MKKPMILLGALAAATVFAAQADEQPVSTEPAQPAAAQPVAEEETEEEDETSLFEVSLTLDVNSAYVSHNRIFSDTPVAQYDLWMQMNLPEDFGWLAFDVWANQELNKAHASNSRGNGGKKLGGLGEFDYEIVYGNSLGPVNFTASHLWYTYPRCGWGSQKFWTVGAEYDNEFVVPSVKLFWEYDRAGYSKQDCFMIDFALSRGFELAEDLTLTFTSKTTLYTEGYVKALTHDADNPGEGLHRPAFGGWDNGVALSYALTDNISLGAHLNYLYRLDHSVRHAAWDPYAYGTGSGDYSSTSYGGILYGGVSASLSF